MATASCMLFHGGDRHLFNTHWTFEEYESDCRLWIDPAMPGHALSLATHGMHMSPGDAPLCLTLAVPGTVNSGETASMLFTDAGEREFVDGFTKAAPAGYDQQADDEAQAPWCRPWYGRPAEEWFLPTMTAWEMGQRWAFACGDELREWLDEVQYTV